ncbi:MAG: FIG00820637:: Acyl dehydratase, partial [uncultured Sphingomonas sp.]
ARTLLRRMAGRRRHRPPNHAHGHRDRQSAAQHAHPQSTAAAPGCRGSGGKRVRPDTGQQLLHLQPGGRRQRGRDDAWHPHRQSGLRRGSLSQAGVHRRHAADRKRSDGYPRQQVATGRRDRYLGASRHQPARRGGLHHAALGTAARQAPM